MSEMEALSQTHSQAKVTWLQISEVADFGFNGQHCIIIDDPDYRYLTTPNAKFFRGFQRMLHCPGWLCIAGSLDSQSSGPVTGLCRTIRSDNAKERSGRSD